MEHFCHRLDNYLIKQGFELKFRGDWGHRKYIRQNVQVCIDDFQDVWIYTLDNEYHIGSGSYVENIYVDNLDYEAEIKSTLKNIL